MNVITCTNVERNLNIHNVHVLHVLVVHASLLYIVHAHVIASLLTSTASSAGHDRSEDVPVSDAHWVPGRRYYMLPTRKVRTCVCYM